MAGRFLMIRALSARMATPLGTRAAHVEAKYPWIGNREIVGYGYNGVPNYADRAEFPMPAIRWKEPTSDITVRFERSNLFCTLSFSLYLIKLTKIIT